MTQKTLKNLGVFFVPFHFLDVITWNAEDPHVWTPGGGRVNGGLGPETSNLENHPVVGSEIWRENHLGCKNKPINNGRNYQPQLVS